MTSSARTTTHRASTILMAGLLMVIAAITATVGYQSLNSASSTTAASPTDSVAGAQRQAPTSSTEVVPRSGHRGSPTSPIDRPRSEHRGALGVADGVVPDDTTVFDDDVPAVANLDPDLLRALRRAATDAADDGVEFLVNSGWRSRNDQEQLFREAVSKYGSKEQASRWVATPGTSAHESGAAVDIGPSKAAAWLSEHATAYRLCRIYDNEPWHYELRPEAVDRGCPARYADPTQDPRMQH